MESITRNVRDLEADKRHSLETVLGHQLQDNQQVIIQVVSMDVDRKNSQPQQPASTADGDTRPQLPDWCNVYEGLNDDEVADLEKTILKRADLTRSF